MDAIRESGEQDSMALTCSLLPSGLWWCVMSNGLSSKILSEEDLEIWIRDLTDSYSRYHWKLVNISDGEPDPPYLEQRVYEFEWVR